MKELKISHPLFGHYRVRFNSRAKHYIIKIVRGEVVVILPLGGSIKKASELVNKELDRITLMLQKCQDKVRIDADFQMQTLTFKVVVSASEGIEIASVLRNSVLNISYPYSMNIEQEEIQKRLVGIIEQTLRSEAKRYLPTRCKVLADLYGKQYESVKINGSKTRWGSCSIRKSINFSYKTLLLPTHLVDYIILHELAHTDFMNHSSSFWLELDRMTENKAFHLRNELKQITKRLCPILRLFEA